MSLSKQKFREIVVQLLYSRELGKPEEDDEQELAKVLSVNKRVLIEAQKQVEEVLQCLDEIDPIIAEISHSYSLPRIHTVERNILRLSCYELLHESRVSSKTVIAEGIRLAKKFASSSSAEFIHAILDKVQEKKSDD